MKIKKLSLLTAWALGLCGAPAPSKPTTQPPKHVTPAREENKEPRLALDYLLGDNDHLVARVLVSLVNEVYTNQTQYRELFGALEQTRQFGEEYLRVLNKTVIKGEKLGNLVLRDVRHNMTVLFQCLTTGFTTDLLTSLKSEVLNYLPDDEALVSKLTLEALSLLIAIHTLASALSESEIQSLLDTIKALDHPKLDEAQKAQVSNLHKALSQMTSRIAHAPGIETWREVCTILANGMSFVQAEAFVKRISASLLSNPKATQAEKLVARELIAMSQLIFGLYRKHHLAHAPTSKPL